MRNKNGFTLVELLVTIVVIGIMSAITAGVFIGFSNFFTNSTQLTRVRSMATKAMDIMIEGDFIAHRKIDGTSEQIRSGLRYAVRIESASATELTYVIGYPVISDQREVTIRYDGNNIYRSLTNPVVAPDMLPYYGWNGTVSTPAPNELFKYYDADFNLMTTPIANPENIRRVEINATFREPYGGYTASFNVMSGVDINQKT